MRYHRFIEFYNQYHKNIDGMSLNDINISKEEWLPNAPAKAIREAVKIYETKGAEALYRWMEKQSFAVIRTGYDIGEVLSPKVKGYERPAQPGSSKKHLRPRQSIIYHKYDRHIIARFASYIRQMVYSNELKSSINAWKHMTNAHMDKFNDNKTITTLIDRNITEILGRAEYRGIYEKIVFDIYAQAARAIFLDPRKGVRNLMQNIAFHTAIIGEVGKTKKLTKAEKRFFETHVSQMTGIVHDLLFQQYEGFGSLPVMKQLNQFADYINMIGRTDTINRLWDFSMITNNLKSVMKKHAQMETVKDVRNMMKAAGLGELTTTERIHALEKLASEGEQAFIHNVANSIVKKDHFVYDRYLRSPEEQGSNFAKVLSNLTTFPKGYIQRIALDAKKVFSKTEREINKGTGATNSRAVSTHGST